MRHVTQAMCAVLLVALPWTVHAQSSEVATRLQKRVWVNLNTKVYHCPTSRYYGTGTNGDYMKEAEARARGFHAASRRGCDADGEARRVWVNEGSKVYHCPGSRAYGNTATGRYMSEAAALVAGYRAAGGRPCA